MSNMEGLFTGVLKGLQSPSIKGQNLDSIKQRKIL